MRKFLYSLIMITMLFLSSCSFIAPKTTINNEVHGDNVHVDTNIDILDFEAALCTATEFAEDSCIGIETVNSSLFGSFAFGSGVVLKRMEGVDSTYLYTYYAVTNGHVVSNDGYKIDKICAVLNEEQYKVNAEVVHFLPNEDLALVKFSTNLLLRPATISKTTPKKASYAIAIGNPYDIVHYYNSVAVGNISHASRTIQEDSLRGQKVENKYIQTTAAVNPGNSGGGLFNLRGELIGINTWKIVDPEEGIEEMAFAIPISVVTEKFAKYLK